VRDYAVHGIEARQKPDALIIQCNDHAFDDSCVGQATISLTDDKPAVGSFGAPSRRSTSSIAASRWYIWLKWHGVGLECPSDS
jgi:hypothetical protein